MNYTQLQLFKFIILDLSNSRYSTPIYRCNMLVHNWHHYGNLKRLLLYNKQLTAPIYFKHMVFDISKCDYKFRQNVLHLVTIFDLYNVVASYVESFI